MILEIISIIAIAVILALVFFYGLRKTGPWGSLWAFILVLVSAMLLYTVWTDPYGPVYWGIGWVDLLIIALLFALLLAAATPPTYSQQAYMRNDEILPETEEERKYDLIVSRGIFWVLIILFVVLIILGVWQ
jgi:hypothetical protein